MLGLHSQVVPAVVQRKLLGHVRDLVSDDSKAALLLILNADHGVQILRLARASEPLGRVVVKHLVRWLIALFQMLALLWHLLFGDLVNHVLNVRE